MKHHRLRIGIDWAAVKTAVRTSGALMIGNVFVAGLIFDNRNFLNLSLLLISGFSAIILTSLIKE